MATASVHPKTQPGTPQPQPQQVAAGKPKPAPQEQANAYAPPANNNGGLISGAQPVVPAGKFNSRWAGF